MSLFVLSGCVSSSKYEELEKKFKATDSKKSELQKELDQANSKIQEMRLLITELQNQLGNTSRDKSKLQASVKEMQEAIADLTKRKQETEKRIREFRDLTNKFKKFIDTGRLSVKIIDGRMVVALNSDVLFSSGSSRLSNDGATAIEEVALLLASIPNKKYQVEGHTDNVPIRTKVFPSNWDLASARALTVLKKMTDAGLSPNRISAASFGEHNPVASNDSKDGRQQNRRIEIIIVPDLSNLPGFEELKQVSGEQNPVDKVKAL
jgi:chemotaxis protein MotB